MRSGYLIVSAVCPRVAVALVEVSTIFQLHDPMTREPSIKAEIGAERLIKRGYFVLAVSSSINVLGVWWAIAATAASVSGPLAPARHPRYHSPQTDRAPRRSARSTASCIVSAIGSSC